jgi:hypothetical protein
MHKSLEIKALGEVLQLVRGYERKQGGEKR